MDAVGDGGMIEEEEDVDRIGVRIHEKGFAIGLEGTSEGLAGIGNYAVGDFEAVDVGLMLLITAESISNSVGSKTEESQKQEEGGERSPIIE